MAKIVEKAYEPLASQGKRCYHNGKLYPLGVRDSALPPLDFFFRISIGLILYGKLRCYKSFEASSRDVNSCERLFVFITDRI